MKEALLLALAVIAFTAAVFTPSAPDDGEAARGAGASESEGHAPERDHEADTFAQWSSRQTALERSGDGHFYADVTINGSSVHALVDTGASLVALTGNDARALGVTWNDADVQEVGSGASGPVMGVPVTLDRVELGTHQATHVSAVVIPEGLAITLLGQSFLSTINPVRIEDNRMVLGR